MSTENIGQTGQKIRAPVKWAGYVILAGVLLIMINPFYSINQTERGVVLRNGAYVGTSAPGLHTLVPMLDSVHRISVQTLTYNYDKVNSYSADQQPADLKISVTFRVNPDRVSDIYNRFGSLESAVSRAVSPHVFQQSKVVFGQYTAVRAIQDRGRLNADMRAAIAEALKGEESIIVEGLQIENIEFSPGYIHSIEQRMAAEVEVQKLQQQALQAKVTAEITVTQAKAQADAIRAKAQADADATRLRGEAEADAVKAKGNALRDNPGLTELIKAERWNGALPSQMIPNSAIPIIGAK